MLIVAGGLILSVAATGSTVAQEARPAAANQFDGDAAFEILREICDIGPRVSASAGMKKQQAYLRDYFRDLDIDLLTQTFRVKSPYPPNRNVPLQNLMARFHPDRTQRILICCHYDTRPFADKDPRNPRARFLGANDGASGVALLCELGKHLGQLDGPYGIDLMFFDGEEFVIDRRIHPMFLGSTYFSEQYRDRKIPWRYQWGLLVDMVADKDLQIYYEGNSLGDAGQLTRSVWSVAHDLNVTEFIAEERHKIRDDHLPLNAIAGIPTCDIIDFDYPNPEVGNKYWHTQEDRVENCSAESLGKVGKVVLEWICRLQKLNQTND